MFRYVITFLFSYAKRFLTHQISDVRIFLKLQASRTLCLYHHAGIFHIMITAIIILCKILSYHGIYICFSLTSNKIMDKLVSVLFSVAQGGKKMRLKVSKRDLCIYNNNDHYMNNGNNE